MAFKELYIGYRGFQLFSEATLDDMIGLELPYVVQCQPSDRLNLKTIVNLLQKTRRLKLEHMSHTWTILKVIGQYPSKFTNIRGLHLEYDEKVHEAICDIPAIIM